MAVLLKGINSLRHRLELHGHRDLVFTQAINYHFIFLVVLAISLFSSPFERRCEIVDIFLHSVNLIEAPTGHVIHR